MRKFWWIKVYKQKTLQKWSEFPWWPCDMLVCYDLCELWWDHQVCESVTPVNVDMWIYDKSDWLLPRWQDDRWMILLEILSFSVSNCVFLNPQTTLLLLSGLWPLMDKIHEGPLHMCLLHRYYTAWARVKVANGNYLFHLLWSQLCLIPLQCLLSMHLFPPWLTPAAYDPSFPNCCMQFQCDHCQNTIESMSQGDLDDLVSYSCSWCSMRTFLNSWLAFAELSLWCLQLHGMGTSVVSLSNCGCWMEQCTGFAAGVATCPLLLCGHYAHGYIYSIPWHDLLFHSLLCTCLKTWFSGQQICA